MSNTIISYLAGLRDNNNREWYHAHKEDYQEANTEFLSLIQELILKIGEKDSSILSCSPKELTFKLVRDTRFSNDKSPYNPTFRCHISSAGKMPVPVGYFLLIHPGNFSFLGGGLFADMFKDATAMIRNYISSHSDEFESIIMSPEFGFNIKGTELKNVPKEFSPDHPMAKYFKYKSWYIEHPFDDSMLDKFSEFVDYAAEKFLMMKPFNDFINRALKDFKMPER